MLVEGILVSVWTLLIFWQWLRLKKGVLTSLWFLAIILGYVAQLNQWLDQPWISLDTYLWIGFACGVFFIDPKALFLKKPQSYQQLKASYDALSHEAENLRQRFIATLNVLPEGLAYKNHKGACFGTDRYVETLGLNDHQFTETQFLERMFADDLKPYEGAIKKVKGSDKIYRTKYRYLIHERYQWIEEMGTVVMVDKKPLTVSLIRHLDTKQHPRSSLDVLNQMPLEDVYDKVLSQLHHQARPYDLVLFELQNIPLINERYGRDVGDLMMAEFLEKIRYQFVKEAQRVFRVKGITFALILTDRRKGDILKKALKENSAMMQTQMQFGAVKERLIPYFGIVSVTTFQGSFLDIKEAANQALSMALKEHTHENYMLVEWKG